MGEIDKNVGKVETVSKDVKVGPDLKNCGLEDSKACTNGSISIMVHSGKGGGKEATQPKICVNGKM